MRYLAVIVAFVFLFSPAVVQKSAGPANGTLIVDGNATGPIVRRFVERAGGAQARIVVIATAPSSIRFGPDNVILDPDWPRDRQEWRRDLRQRSSQWFLVLLAQARRALRSFVMDQA